VRFVFRSFPFIRCGLRNEHKRHRVDPNNNNNTMIKNRKSASPVLPVTASDGNGEAAAGKTRWSSSSQSRTSAADGRGGEMLSFVKFLTILVACGFFAVFVLRSTVATARQPHLSSGGGAFAAAGDDTDDPDSEFHKKPVAAEVSPLKDQEEEAAARNLQKGPFDEFTTLSAQLASHDLVLLYFAASWCPMSTPITNLLDDLFRDKLLNNKSNDSSDFTVLYVSSDKDETSFQNYLKPGWEAVPYNDFDERARLKQHFRTCAKREMAELELAQRDGELPTVIVLDGPAARSSNNNHNSQQVILTRHGIKDMKDLGAGALDHWKELQRLARALDRKQHATIADMR